MVLQQIVWVAVTWQDEAIILFTIFVVIPKLLKHLSHYY
jgi:hypothetical protein